MILSLWRSKRQNWTVYCLGILTTCIDSGTTKINKGSEPKEFRVEFTLPGGRGMQSMWSTWDIWGPGNLFHFVCVYVNYDIFKILYWSIVELQCSVGFRCTAQWFSSKGIYFLSCDQVPRGSVTFILNYTCSFYTCFYVYNMFTINIFRRQDECEERAKRLSEELRTLAVLGRGEEAGEGPGWRSKSLS